MLKRSASTATLDGVYEAVFDEKKEYDFLYDSIKRSDPTAVHEAVFDEKKYAVKRVCYVPDGFDAKTLDVLRLMWSVHNVNARNCDDEFIQLFLDEGTVYNIGYLLGKSYMEISLVQTMTLRRPQVMFDFFINRFPFRANSLAREALNEIRLRAKNAWEPQPDGVLHLNQDPETGESPDYTLFAKDICEILAFFDITSFPLPSSAGIAYNAHQASVDLFLPNEMLTFGFPDPEEEEDSDASVEF